MPEWYSRKQRCKCDENNKDNAEFWNGTNEMETFKGTQVKIEMELKNPIIQQKSLDLFILNYSWIKG